MLGRVGDVEQTFGRHVARVHAEDGARLDRAARHREQLVHSARLLPQHELASRRR